MATSAATSTFVRVYNSPEGEQTRQLFEGRQGHYRYLWSWYKSAVFDDAAAWAVYKSRYNLYRHIRPIYNPARRLVDFYAGAIYPGVLSLDASRLPDGTPLAIPMAEDTPQELKDALGQLWAWSNWTSGKSLLPRYGAGLGDVFAEVVDDPAKGKAWIEVVWPGLIADLSLDPRGNVDGYRMEYEVADGEGGTYTWAKEVDKGETTFFRDDTVTERRPNPYGFVPAVWINHTDLGGDHGDPAMRNLPKWDEINGLASATHDQIHKILAAPVLLAGMGAAGVGGTQSKQGSTHDLTAADNSRESVNVIRGGPDAKMQALELPQGDALAHINALLEEIERDHPELGMYHQLRGMSQVTGPGADRMFGDVVTLVNDARANYDRGSVALFQMAIAISGWRAQRGDWGRSLTRQQEKFLPFNLDSFTRGDLDMEIMPRPLVPQTPMERLQEERQRQALTRDAQTPGRDATPNQGAPNQGDPNSLPGGVMARLQQAAQGG